MRVSLGLENTEADVEGLVRVLQGIARRAPAGDGATRAPSTSLKQRLKDYTLIRSERVYAATDPTA